MVNHSGHIGCRHWSPAMEGRLELRDFGVFDVQIRKARKARNPATGEEVLVPEGRRVRFKMGKVTEERVGNGAVPAGQANRAAP